MRGLFLTALLALIGCGLFGADEDAGDGEDPLLVETRFFARLNGEPWGIGGGSASFGCIGEYLMFTIGGGEVTRERWPYQEALSLKVQYEGPGTYSLVRTLVNEDLYLFSGAFYYELNGEVAFGDYYSVGDSSANWLKITRYDPKGSTETSRAISRNNRLIDTAGIVEGTFRTTVVVSPEDKEPEPGEWSRRRPDTLHFTEGRFRLGVVEIKDAREECGPVAEEHSEEGRG